jgi:hypothetical protein
VLPLARIIASKKAAGRAKDLAMLPALEDALRALEARRRSRPGHPPSARAKKARR